MGNKNQKPFKRILDELERKHFNFDGDGNIVEYDLMEGNHESTTYQADPYQIIVRNTRDVAQTAVIFGRNRNSQKTRFGNPNGIEISVGQPGVEYIELLQESAETPFSTQFLRIESENRTQLTKFISITEQGANGILFRRQINMQQYRSAYQNQDNLLDVPIDERINGKTYWEMQIEPETTVVYTIFPSYKVDTSSTLRGKDPIKSYARARVNTMGYQVLPTSGHQLKR